MDGFNGSETCYDPETNTFYLGGASHLRIDSGTKRGESINSNGQKYDIETRIIQAMGYAIADNVSAIAENGSWPNLEAYEHDISVKLLADGIARWAENKVRPMSRKSFNLSATPGDFEGCKNTGEIGYALVAPILDRYGRKGVEFIVKNTIFKDMSFQEYQGRAAAALTRN
jgi:hypothetical protein